MLAYKSGCYKQGCSHTFFGFASGFLFCGRDTNGRALVWQKSGTNDFLTKYRKPIISVPSLAKKSISFEFKIGAGWSSLVARWAHNPKVVSSNLAPATKYNKGQLALVGLLFYLKGNFTAPEP